LFFYLRPLSHLQVAYSHCHTNDEESSNEHEDATDRGDGTESHSVLDDKKESVPGGGTEVLISKSDLNVGVLSNKLDAAIEASQQVGGAAEQDLHYLVVFVRCLNLLAVVLKYNADELNHCYDE
jgi:hypothetical protein